MTITIDEIWIGFVLGIIFATLLWIMVGTFLVKASNKKNKNKK